MTALKQTHSRLAGEHRFCLSANLSLLFTELEFSERSAAAADAGFDAVEFWPTEDVDQGIAAARAARIPIALLNVPTGAAGEHGRLIHRESMSWWRGMFSHTVRQAEVTGCRRITVIAGNCRPGVARSEYDDVLRENLDFALEIVAGTDITVLLEPLNSTDRPDHYLLRLDHAVELVSEFNSPNLRLLFDAYHLAQSESDLVHAMHESFPHIGYIQIADAPGRNEPGTGVIDFEAVLDAAIQHGYDGYIGCEFAPKTTTAESLYALKHLLGAKAIKEGEHNG